MALIVSYSSQKLMASCTQLKAMNKAFTSPEVRKALPRRIKELESATYRQDVLDGLGKWHPLTGRGELVYAAHLGKNWRIVAQFDTRGDGVLVVAVEDYH